MLLRSVTALHPCVLWGSAERCAVCCIYSGRSRVEVLGLRVGPLRCQEGSSWYEYLRARAGPLSPVEPLVTHKAVPKLANTSLFQPHAGGKRQILFCSHRPAPMRHQTQAQPTTSNHLLIAVIQITDVQLGC